MKGDKEEMVEPYKPLYTAKQAAQILLVNVGTVYDLMNTGQLPYLILGKGNGSRKSRKTFPGI